MSPPRLHTADKDASRRPTVSKLLQSSIIRKRLNLVPANDTGGRWADDDRKSHVLATIKVPKHLGRKKVALNFPVRWSCLSI